jgi:hypothetical protein
VQDKLDKYDLTEIDPSDTKWNNMIKVVNKLSLTQITFENLTEFINLMDAFGAKSILNWYDVLTRLNEIKITNYSNIKIFITKITEFGVRYNVSFEEFIETFVNFKMDLSEGLTRILKMISDMQMVNLNYGDKKQIVNNLVAYFIKCNYTLNTYYIDNSVFNLKFNCDSDGQINLPPVGFPETLINGLHKFSTIVPTNKNDIYDITHPELLEGVSLCDVIRAQQQAILLCSSLNEKNGVNAIIAKNVHLIIAFVYKEEFHIIMEGKSDAYSDKQKVASLVRDMATAMKIYASSFKEYPEDKRRITEYDLYNSISNFLNVFPALAFQFICNEIVKNNQTKKYYVLVEPSNTNSKANTNSSYVDRNKRPNPPVV